MIAAIIGQSQWIAILHSFQNPSMNAFMKTQECRLISCRLISLTLVSPVVTLKLSINVSKNGFSSAAQQMFLEKGGFTWLKKK
jgi:hypothetical protein